MQSICIVVFVPTLDLGYQQETVHRIGAATQVSAALSHVSSSKRVCVGLLVVGGLARWKTALQSTQ